MNRTLLRGALAGAAGTAALNAVTYTDMALRGRAASDAPGQAIEALIEKAGGKLPGRGAERESRRTALGAVSGIAVGVGIGIAASVARNLGVRFTGPTGAALTGAAAMAASDVPLAALGVSDPRTWAPADWTLDIAGHLAYGVATRAVLEATDPAGSRGLPFPARDGAIAPGPTRSERRRLRADARRAARPSARLVFTAGGLGVAAGIRSSLGFAGPAFAAPPAGRGLRSADRLKRVVTGAAVAGELIADKLPATPSRLSPPALGGRLFAGAAGAVSLARRERAVMDLPVAAGLTGALIGSVAGLRWRQWAKQELGWTWQAALIEDAAGISLAALASRR